jgi:transcriptional regulator
VRIRPQHAREFAPMSLYTPPLFRADDRAAISRLMHDQPFATLLTPADGEPHVSHVPLLLLPDCEPHGTLIGHFARGNPHAQAAASADSIAVFHGPHAYVSPTWYAEPAKAVPTWNYAAVHAHGRLEILADPVDARAILDTLVQRFEGGRPAPWTFAMAARERDALVGGIVAFRMRIKRLDAKFKLSQNRPAGDRARVIAALDAEPHAESRATAAWMRSYAAPPDGAG